MTEQSIVDAGRQFQIQHEDVSIVKGVVHIKGVPIGPIQQIKNLVVRAYNEGVTETAIHYIKGVKI